MSDLTDFLLARIAEDEAAAQDSLERGFGGWEWLADLGVNFEARTHIVRHDPARVIAECRAKRELIELTDEATGLDLQVDGEFAVGPRDTDKDPYIGDAMLRHMAAPYAYHPDYREEWRP